MSSSHGSTSGHPAHPSPPSGSGHSSLSQQQQHQQQSSSDDGLSRRLPERRRADVAPKTQAVHPPISSPPKQPPPSASASSSLSTSSSAPQPSSSSKSAVISSFAAAAAPKAQQPCAQLAKDKSACRDYKVESIAGAPGSTAKSVYVAQDRKAFPRVDPAERLLMTGEEMAGTRPKRPRGSSQTHMEVDITPSEHHTRVQRVNGAHRDTMRSETHVHTQEMLTDEEESDEPRKGETIAEIHFYREDTPPSIASLGLPSSEDQTPPGDYTSVSATVIRKHSMKGPAVTPDQPPLEQSSSADSRNAQQSSAQKLPAIQDKADVEKMVEQTDSVMQPVEEDSEGAKSATLSPNSNRTTTLKTSVLQQSAAAAQAGVKAPHADQSQSKVLKEEEKSKTASSKSSKEQEKSSSQNDSLDTSKRIPGILPPEEEWESTYDPNQPLEERLTATVIRRHIKSKTTTPASSTTKKQQSDPNQESSMPTDTSSDTAHAETPGDVLSPTKDKSFALVQDKLPAKNGPSEELPKTLIGDSTSKTAHQSPVLQHNGDTLHSVLKLDSKTAKDPSQRIMKTELITSSVCDSSKDLNSSVKKSVQTSVGVKDVVVSVQSDAAESTKERNSMKKESALQGSTLLSKKEMPVVLYSAGSKSPSPGKRVSIREPPETVVHEDSDVSAQRTSKSGASKTSPSAKDVESAESSRPAGDSEVESGSWVEEGCDAATKAEVNGLANPRNSKSCCFCWCCCCSCSCLSVNNNIRRSNASKQQQPAPGGNIDHYFNGEGEPQPTLEDIRTWGESFDKLMKCGAGRKVFREFLQCEYSEENILFWLACEDLKKETNPEVVEEKARVIYEDFISILSPREVSLDSRVRDIINKNMVRPTPNTFDEAQLQIYTLMHRDSYPRFVNSPIYRKLAQLPVPSRKGSMA